MSDPCDLCDQFHRALAEPKNSKSLQAMLKRLYADHKAKIHPTKTKAA